MLEKHWFWGAKALLLRFKLNAFAIANSMLLQSNVNTSDNQGDRFPETHTFQLDFIFRAYEYFFHTR